MSEQKTRMSDPFAIAKAGNSRAWKALSLDGIRDANRHVLITNAMQGRNVAILRDLLSLPGNDTTNIDVGHAALRHGFHEALPLLRESGFPIQVGENVWTLGNLMWTRSPGALANTLTTLMDVGLDHEDGSRLLAADVLNGNLGLHEGGAYGSVFATLLLWWRRTKNIHRTALKETPPRSEDYVQVLLGLGDLNRLNDYSRQRLVDQMDADPAFAQLIAGHKRQRLMALVGDRPAPVLKGEPTPRGPL